MSLIDQARLLAKGEHPPQTAVPDQPFAPGPDMPEELEDSEGFLQTAGSTISDSDSEDTEPAEFPNEEPHMAAPAREPEPAVTRRPRRSSRPASDGATADSSPNPLDAPGANLPSVNFSARVIANNETGRLPIEQYRKLAAVLHHEQADSGLKVLMVASPLAGDGKTLTAVNLALTLSESYHRRVLLVDGDLRSPSIHRLFGVDNTSGLDEGLRADRERKLTLVEVSPQLTLLPAGRPDSDPMSVLTSTRMRRVLDEAREKFDWVIVDTPPLGLLPDAHLLARMVDGTVLVVAAGCTSYQSTARAAELLGRNRILGVVLNRVDESVFRRESTPRQYYGNSA